MSDNPQDAATLRARVTYHASAKTAAEARRASMLADRADAIAVLSPGELDEIDDELDALAVQIERAASRVAALQPALDRAAEAEADAERRKRTAGGTAQDAANVKGIADNFGANAAAVVAVTLKAAAIPVRPISQAIFAEPPPPIQTSVDVDRWHREREARIRAERAARAASSSAPHTAPSYAGFSSERN